MNSALSCWCEHPHFSPGSGLTSSTMRTYALFRSMRSPGQWSPENWKVPALVPPPDTRTIRYAVDRAAMLRRRRYQDDDRYRHYSETALLEQVCGVEGV